MGDEATAKDGQPTSQARCEDVAQDGDEGNEVGSRNARNDARTRYAWITYDAWSNDGRSRPSRWDAYARWVRRTPKRHGSDGWPWPTHDARYANARRSSWNAQTML